MDRHVVVITLVGGARLDLSQAELAAKEVTLTKVSLVGGTRLRGAARRPRRGVRIQSGRRHPGRGWPAAGPGRTHRARPCVLTGRWPAGAAQPGCLSGRCGTTASVADGRSRTSRPVPQGQPGRPAGAVLRTEPARPGVVIAAAGVADPDLGHPGLAFGKNGAHRDAGLAAVQRSVRIARHHQGARPGARQHPSGHGRVPMDQLALAGMVTSNRVSRSGPARRPVVQHGQVARGDPAVARPEQPWSSSGPPARNALITGVSSAGHSRASPDSPNSASSARMSSGFSATPWTSPSSSRPDPASDRCAAARAAGSTVRGRPVNGNSATARRSSGSDATLGMHPSWGLWPACAA